MFLDRKRAEEKMDKYGVKALVTFSPANVFYTSDLCPYEKCFIPYHASRALGQLWPL
jgi:hypothetical protein